MDKLAFGLQVSADFIKNFHKLLIPHKLTLKNKTSEGGITTFIFTSKKPIGHKAGQYGTWWQKHFIKGLPERLFTIASPPGDDEIWLSTRISKTDYKQKLSKLQPGQSLYMFGPVGNFTVPEPAPDQIVLVAGGIGITPMRAIAKDLFDKKAATKVTLIHSADDTYLYRSEMEKYCGETHFTDREGFGETCGAVIEKAGKNAPYFISGPPGFVVAAEKELKKRGVQTIKKDGFLGY